MYSDNGTTFKAAANVLPQLFHSEELQSFFRKNTLPWEFIPPYSPSQGGAWKSLIKVFKRTLTNTVYPTERKPTIVELQTYISNVTRIVNDRPLISQSDDRLDYNAITSSSLLTPSLDPALPIGHPHTTDHLRLDYRYNAVLAQHFWKRWIKFYLPNCKGERNGSNTQPSFRSGKWF